MEGKEKGEKRFVNWGELFEDEESFIKKDYYSEILRSNKKISKIHDCYDFLSEKNGNEEEKNKKIEFLKKNLDYHKNQDMPLDELLIKSEKYLLNLIKMRLHSDILNFKERIKIIFDDRINILKDEGIKEKYSIDEKKVETIKEEKEKIKEEEGREKEREKSRIEKEIKDNNLGDILKTYFGLWSDIEDIGKRLNETNETNKKINKELKQKMGEIEGERIFGEKIISDTEIDSLLLRMVNKHEISSFVLRMGMRKLEEKIYERNKIDDNELLLDL